MQIKIYYEDTDAGGVVYHANYLKFCERARSEAFYVKGLTPELESGHFVARKLTADYITSAKLGDVLKVTSKLVSMKGASFVVEQNIYKDEKIIFSLEIVLAYISFEGKPKKIDAKTKELLLSLF